jgi:hypothetical protein
MPLGTRCNKVGACESNSDIRSRDYDSPHVLAPVRSTKSAFVDWGRCVLPSLLEVSPARIEVCDSAQGKNREELGGQVSQLRQVFEFFRIGDDKNLGDSIFRDFYAEHAERAPVEVGHNARFSIDV